MGKLPTDEQVQAVFSAWRGYRPNPDRVLLTDARRKAITARLRDGHTADELVVLVGAYAHHADTDEARWWRGDNPDGREYLDLVNLLRTSKTAGRVERALRWAEQSGDDQVAEVPDVNLGPMAVLLGHGEAEYPDRLVHVAGPSQEATRQRPPARVQPVRGRVLRRR